MKIETTALEDQQTRLTAEIDHETLERFKRQAARKISQAQKFPGFRPGKAPYDFVRRMVGDEALTQEAIELMLDEVYPQALREANIEPSGQGRLEKIVSMDPPVFEFVIPLPPSVTMGDYKTIQKPYEQEPVTDEQVEATIKRLQRSYATQEPVERAAQPGDLVAIKLTAKRTQPAEGEPEILVEETPYQMIAGEEQEAEEEVWPYEDFNKELVGLSANDTKTVIHTFSDESPYEDLRGKEAEFTINVQNIKELHLPELTDEFAKGLGEFETMEDLRKAVRSQLEQQGAQQYDKNYFDELINELVTMSTVKYPPHMLDEEVEEFIHGVEHNLEHDRLDLETYLKMREMDRETFVEQEVKPAATRRLIRSLVLEEFARQEQIEVKSDEVRSVYYAALQQMQQSSDLRKMQTRNKKSTRDMANSIAINTVNNIFNQRLMSRLKSIATGEEEQAVDSGEMTEISDAEMAAAEAAAGAEAAVGAEEASAAAGAEDQPETGLAAGIDEQSAVEVQPEADEQPEADNPPAAEDQPEAEDQPGEAQA